MIEEIVASVFSGRGNSLNSLARNRLFHWFINSEAAYRLLEWQVSKYIRLLREPTNKNVLEALSKLEKITHYSIPDGRDRIFESDFIGALREEFKRAVKTGKDTNLTKKAKRTIGLMGEKYLRTVLLDFGAVNFGVGILNRRFKEGEPYFNYLALQPNSDCNALPRCPGCFAEKSEGRLDYETLDSVVGQSVALTARYAIVLGGEPLLEKDNLFRLFRKHSRMPFLVSTNGKLVDDSYAGEVAELGNVITFINIPGLEPTATMIRRDPNVWNEIRAAAENLRKHRAASGFVSTVYQANFEDLSSHEFVKRMVDFGMMLGFYFRYRDPVGCSPREELALSDKMIERFSRRVNVASDNYPLILVNTVRGEETRVGCPSAKGALIYVQSDGKVAGCPMAPQPDDELNVKKRPLRDILASNYFERIRSERPVCLRQPEFLARLSQAEVLHLKSGGG